MIANIQGERCGHPPRVCSTVSRATRLPANSHTYYPSTLNYQPHDRDNWKATSSSVVRQLRERASFQEATDATVNIRFRRDSNRHGGRNSPSQQRSINAFNPACRFARARVRWEKLKYTANRIAR